MRYVDLSSRLSFSFLPGVGGGGQNDPSGKMRLYGLLEGQVCIRVQSMWQTRGVRGVLPWEILILDLLLSTIR